jgi:glutamyl-tRNA synthetase
MAVTHAPTHGGGRFAPSPSGPLHVGNLRTALLAWLFARARGAPFYLRIEDLDRARSRPEHEAGQLADLRRLGIDWDGDPVRQSERLPRHRAAMQELRERRLLYPCWCTRAEIRAAASAPHGHAPEGAYPGTCRRLSAGERTARERQGRPAAWRLDAGARWAGFVDRLHGPVQARVDDFVVWREALHEGGPGTPAYNLAVVVDDADQGVEEVVRGDDLLPTTPRQVLLAELLGLCVPSYAHVALVVARDRSRLAKRHGAVTLEEQLAGGRTVPELVSWMARSAGLIDDPAPRRARDLLADFDPVRLTPEATVWEAGGAPAARMAPGR